MGMGLTRPTTNTTATSDVPWPVYRDANMSMLPHLCMACTNTLTISPGFWTPHVRPLCASSNTSVQMVRCTLIMLYPHPQRPSLLKTKTPCLMPCGQPTTTTTTKRPATRMTTLMQVTQTKVRLATEIRQQPRSKTQRQQRNHP